MTDLKKQVTDILKAHAKGILEDALERMNRDVEATQERLNRMSLNIMEQVNIGERLPEIKIIDLLTKGGAIYTHVINTSNRPGGTLGILFNGEYIFKERDGGFYVTDPQIKRYRLTLIVEPMEAPKE